MNKTSWSLISTFPYETKPWADGHDNMVLVYGSEGICIGWVLYDYEDDGTPTSPRWMTGDCWPIEPTHFMPLPQPPVDQ